MSATENNSNSSAGKNDPWVVLLCAAGLCCWILFAFGILLVVPQFFGIFDGLKVDLPAPTNLVLGLARNGPISAAAVVAVSAGVAYLAYVRKIRRLGWYLLVSGLLAVVLSAGAIYLPLYKIDHALKRK